MMGWCSQRPVWSTNRAPLKATGRSLDVAIQGNAFLSVQTAAGNRVTRDGRLQLGKDGQLEAMDGSPVLGKNGQPIKMDPKNGNISISAMARSSRMTRRWASWT